MAETYRVLRVKRTGPNADQLLHLVRDGAPASMCGLARETLDRPGMFDQRLCPDCVEQMMQEGAVRIP